MNLSETTMQKTESSIYLDLELLRGLEELGSPGADSLVAELAHIFTDTTPVILTELRMAAKNDQGTTASRLAHRLKGSAANIGAKHMAALCAQLEKSASTNPTKINQEIVERIIESFSASVHALQQHITTARQN